MVNWSKYEGVCYDDVLLVPMYSTLNSRTDCNPYTTILVRGNFNTIQEKEVSPIIAANMAAITTSDMIKALKAESVIVPVHRFCDTQEQFDVLNKGDAFDFLTAVSVGLDDRERIEFLEDSVNMFFLELAHAGTKRAVEEVKWISTTFPNHVLIVGNVATYETAAPLFDAGATYVKVGIGPSGVCSTREITGVGIPQLSAIIDCSRAGPIIGDGGLRNSGDCVKAIAAGASFIMTGSLLAGTNESLKDGYGQHLYYGSASEKNGRVKPGHVPEGIAISNVPPKGPAAKVVQNLMAGIRQGMSMIGATTLGELREMAVFQKVTTNCYLENSTHFNITHK